MATIRTTYNEIRKRIEVEVNGQVEYTKAYDPIESGATNHNDAFRMAAVACGYSGNFTCDAIFDGYIYVQSNRKVTV